MNYLVLCKEQREKIKFKAHKNSSNNHEEMLPNHADLMLNIAHD